MGVVEGVTELLRQMYGLDLKLWAMGSHPDANRAEIQRVGMQNDAILAEVRRTMASWEGRRGRVMDMGRWSSVERQQFEEISRIWHRFLRRGIYEGQGALARFISLYTTQAATHHTTT